jgi:hypothetical protein
MPDNWSFYSIDPILDPIDVSTDTDDYRNRFHQFTCKSEEFVIPSNITTMLHIVIACHSHAPLSEFWARTAHPRIAIAMPCCAAYSELPSDEVKLEFDDYEVYSAKRKIKIYYDKA